MLRSRPALADLSSILNIRDLVDSMPATRTTCVSPLSSLQMHRTAPLVVSVGIAMPFPERRRRSDRRIMDDNLDVVTRSTRDDDI